MALGFGLLLAATLLILDCRLVLFPFDGPATHALTSLWPFLVVQLLLYAAFMRRPTQSNVWALLLLLSIVQGLATFLFLYQFTGGQAYPSPGP